MRRAYKNPSAHQSKRSNNHTNIKKTTNLCLHPSGALVCLPSHTLMAVTLSKSWCDLSSNLRPRRCITEWWILVLVSVNRMSVLATPFKFFSPQDFMLGASVISWMRSTFMFTQAFTFTSSSFLMRQEIQESSGSHEFYFHTIILIKKHLLNIQL